MAKRNSHLNPSHKGAFNKVDLGNPNRHLLAHLAASFTNRLSHNPNSPNPTLMDLLVGHPTHQDRQIRMDLANLESPTQTQQVLSDNPEVSLGQQAALMGREPLVPNLL